MTKTDAAVEITQADINAFCAIFDFKPEMVDADGDDKRVLEILALHRQSSISAATETLEKIAEDLIDQQDEPWLKDDGASHDRVHFWRDKAIVASRDIRAAIPAVTEEGIIYMTKQPHTAKRASDRPALMIEVNETMIQELARLMTCLLADDEAGVPQFDEACWTIDKARAALAHLSSFCS